MVEIMDRLGVIEEWPVRPVATGEDVLEAQRALWGVHVDRNIKYYIADIVEATRRHPNVRLGASPRAAIAMLQLSRALALLEGRAYVTPDDVKQVAQAALSHRIILRPEARLEGATPEDVVADVLSEVPAP